jgi:High potential iron-sulfur protein
MLDRDIRPKGRFGMARPSRIQWSTITRRTIITQALGCVAGMGALAASVKEAAAKMSQASVQYQDTPKGDQQCSNCSLFQAPNSCTLVDGNISPSGWCKFWVKKPS